MPPPHELEAFFQQVATEMAAEYQRIYSRSREDPGTAGDEGESNWARLLSDWLPADVHVAIKGRILATDGTASPQVDIVVLHGDYPRRLRDKKLYLAGGVMAAFECKNTLRKRHLQKVFANAAAIRRLAGPRIGTYYDEGFSPILYGVLAHSHEWSSSTAPRLIDAEISRLHAATAHPADAPVTICVSNLHTWQVHYEPLRPKEMPKDWRSLKVNAESIGSGKFKASNRFWRWASLDEVFPVEGQSDESSAPNAIGEFIMYMLSHMALADPQKERMSEYFAKTFFKGLMCVSTKSWELSEVYSDRLLFELRSRDQRGSSWFVRKNQPNLP